MAGAKSVSMQELALSPFSYQEPEQEGHAGMSGAATSVEDGAASPFPTLCCGSQIDEALLEEVSCLGWF